MLRRLVPVVLILGIAGFTAGAAVQTPANPVIVLETVKGTIEIELFEKDAPKSVAYLLDKVRRGFYRGLRFHRVERQLVQIGDPLSRDMTRKAWWGRQGAEPIGVAEIRPGRQHVRGTVGLAHGGNAAGASTQFYIMRGPSPSLDGDYTIVGRVVRGTAVVDQLQVADMVKQAYVKGERD